MRLYRVRPGGRWYHPAVPRLGAGPASAVALTLSAALTPALDWVGELNGGWFALGAYALLCALVGAVSRPPTAPLVGLAGWLFFDGFAVHGDATLSWSGRTDLLRLGALAAAALLTSLPGALPHRRVRVQRMRAADHQAGTRS
ncbi:hypothetical protein AB0K51_21605 [Kitasatospora sp. NPDC049285]|uniref:hypothetical protein n=1 Tax=Kitasatospora sp. NPDC049285 TaxID=3157096 RepID=UPI003439E3E6